jgi:hypothetical protein
MDWLIGALSGKLAQEEYEQMTRSATQQENKH